MFNVASMDEGNPGNLYLDYIANYRMRLPSNIVATVMLVLKFPSPAPVKADKYIV